MSQNIYKVARLACTPAEAFRMYTFNENLEKWLATKAEVDPVVGGKFELFWNPTDRENDSTIGCQITAIAPDKFIAFNWKGAKQFKHFMNNADPLTEVSVSFVPSTPDATEVHLVHTGWRNTPDWEEARRWFDHAWSAAFEELEKAVNVKHDRLGKIPEAKILKTDAGLVPDGDGWYIINTKDARWRKNAKFGNACNFEGSTRFDQLGINIHTIEPGQPSCHYHGEDNQEDFLVLKGQCKVLIEGQERLLKEWDFVHCPKWTKHVFVGAGDSTCAILMVGARSGPSVIYPVIELAKKYNACPERETDAVKESYANCPKSVESKGQWPI